MMNNRAPELQVSQWLNTDEEITLEKYRGKVILIEAFQMLCPGCVSHALPQAKRAAKMFAGQDLVVLGLHTVFEHHQAQGSAEALLAFLHEYRIPFPVGVDQRVDEERLPRTMQAYQMRGTPTQLLIDREGSLFQQQFGGIEDMQLGANISMLLNSTNSDHSADQLPDSISG